MSERGAYCAHCGFRTISFRARRLRRYRICSSETPYALASSSPAHRKDSPIDQLPVWLLDQIVDEDLDAPVRKALQYDVLDASPRASS